MSKDIFLEILKSNEIDINASEKEGLSILFGFYVNILIDDIKNSINILKHKKIIEDIFYSKDEVLNDLLDIELFVELYIEFGKENNFIKSFNIELIEKYNKAIIEWKNYE